MRDNVERIIKKKTVNKILCRYVSGYHTFYKETKQNILQLIII